MRYSLHTVDAPHEGGRFAAETLARFRDDGAVLIRAALPAALRARIGRDLDLLLAAAERRHGLAPRGRARDAVRRASERLAALAAAAPEAPAAIAEAMGQMPAMHAVAADAGLLRLLGQLLSPRLQVDRRMALDVALPDDAAGARESFAIHGGEGMLSVFAPLQRTDWTNGAPRLALGGHSSGAEAALAGAIETVVEPGDVLVCHGLLPQAFPANHSDAARLAVTLRYRDIAAAAPHPRFAALRGARAAAARRAA